MSQTVKNLPAVQETQVWSLGWENPLEQGMATHSSALVWRILGTEEPVVGYSSWSRKESEMTERLSLHANYQSTVNHHNLSFISFNILLLGIYYSSFPDNSIAYLLICHSFIITCISLLEDKIRKSRELVSLTTPKTHWMQSKHVICIHWINRQIF